MQESVKTQTVKPPLKNLNDKSAKKYKLVNNIYVQILIISSAFLGIFLLSELIYLYYNRPQILSSFFLHRAQSFSRKSDGEKAQKYLITAVKIQLAYNYR